MEAKRTVTSALGITSLHRSQHSLKTLQQNLILFHVQEPGKKIKAISLGRSGFLISILKLAFISHPPAPRAAWVLFLNSNLLTELQLFQQPTNCCREQTSSVLLQLQPAPRAIPTHRRADTGLSAGRALLPSDLSSSHRTSHPDNGRPRGLP